MANIIIFPDRKPTRRKRRTPQKAPRATLTDLDAERFARTPHQQAFTAAVMALRASAEAAEDGDLAEAMDQHRRAGDLLAALRALSSQA